MHNHYLLYYIIRVVGAQVRGAPGPSGERLAALAGPGRLGRSGRRPARPPRPQLQNAGRALAPQLHVPSSQLDNGRFRFEFECEQKKKIQINVLKFQTDCFFHYKILNKNY